MQEGPAASVPPVGSEPGSASPGAPFSPPPEHSEAPRPPTGPTDPQVLDLADPQCCDARLAGAKAANLAVARAAGLPVIPGFVLTTASFDPRAPGWPGAPLPAGVDAALRQAWLGLGAQGDALVVRSSSTVEDIGASSMAGQFQSRLGVVGWDAFGTAVREVLGSSRRTGTKAPDPMAVLVQRQVQATAGGVLFGLDPVTGDRSHILVEVVPGGPDALVSGTVSAQRYLLGRRGRIIEGPDGESGLLDRHARTRLARLAARTAQQFGHVQDVEWAIDADDTLWLLQSRPVTAVGSADSLTGPLMGPGPVAETFPDPLRALEEDLWIDPLRAGIRSALLVVGSWPRRTVDTSPLVVTVGGRVACDLELLGASPVPQSRWRWLDLRVPVRKTASAWRVGRLRAVLPGLAEEICRRVDGELGELGPLGEFGDAELLEVIYRARIHLTAVHGHEVLSGTLLDSGGGLTVAGVAMSVVRRGRALGLSDEEIVQRWPVSLALTVPRIGVPAPLPPTPQERAGDGAAQGATTSLVAALPPREALRLRSRWLQELSARSATLLAGRLASSHRIPDPASLVHLRLTDLEEVVSGWPAPDDLATRTLDATAPLPSCFRFSAAGQPIRVARSGAHRPGGRGAAEGRALGPVVHDPATAVPGAVLVTRTLDPRLAGWLPQLSAVVSETGSVLSHLAILAREFHIPMVVGVHEAVERFEVGALLVVDGATGEVRVADEADRGGDAL